MTTPVGQRRLRGFARQAPPQYSSLGGAANQGSVWSDLSLETYGKSTGLNVQSVMLYQTSDEVDGLTRDWVLPKNLAEHNRGYAIQWFAFALMTLIFWAVHMRRALAKHRDPTEKVT